VRDRNSRQGEKRVLMLVENSHYPGDTRVYNEARTLRDAGYQVSVIAQRKRGSGSPYHQVIDGVQVYRFPMLAEGSGFLSYISEYGLALAAIFVLSLVVLVRHGIDIIHVANPPDLLFLVVAPYKCWASALSSIITICLPSSTTCVRGARDIRLCIARS
jgi:hypothetical protein